MLGVGVYLTVPVCHLQIVVQKTGVALTVHTKKAQLHNANLVMCTNHLPHHSFDVCMSTDTRREVKLEFHIRTEYRTIAGHSTYHADCKSKAHMYKQCSDIF